MIAEGYEKNYDHLYRCNLGPCLYNKMPGTSMHTTALLIYLVYFWK